MRVMSGWVCLGAGVGVVVLFFGMIAWMRISQSLYRARLSAAVRRYVEGRGGVFTPDPDPTRGFTVKGPRGEGHERWDLLQIMCKPGQEGRWETSIGFTLRKYLPDVFDDKLAEAAAKRLAELAPKVAALSEDELRARLRVDIVSNRSSSDGLATCARALAGRHEARVVLEGFDLEGLPKAARVRLSDESDAQLYERALAQTLTEPAPAPSEGRAASHLWLLRPAAIFGDEPHLVVISGGALRWTPVVPGDVEQRLLELCRAAGEDGLGKYVLWSWDGASLGAEPIVVHTIQGPSTPDYTLRVPASFHPTLGVHAAADGTFGVRRPGR